MHDWTLFLGTHEIKFKVSADLKLARGLYYIEWTVE
jgi:hypothetical protein